MSVTQERNDAARDAMCEIHYRLTTPGASDSEVLHALVEALAILYDIGGGPNYACLRLMRADGHEYTLTIAPVKPGVMTAEEIVDLRTAERDEALARADKAEAERDEARRLLAAAVDLSEEDERERDEVRRLAGRVRATARAVRYPPVVDTHEAAILRAARMDAAVDAIPAEWEVSDG